MILFTGGCLTDPDRHPMGRPPPRADTPQEMGTAADSTHPTGMHSVFFFKKIEDVISLFCGTTEVRAHPSLACNGLLRFTSGATPVDVLIASIAVEPF